MTAATSPLAPYADTLTFGLDVRQPLVVRKALLKGLPFTAFDKLVRATALPRPEVAGMIGMSQSTLSRRQKARKLDPDESDRLFRIATLYSQLLQHFNGKASAATAWLKAPHAVFDGVTPLDMAKTDYGARQVEALIYKLEHGVYV